MNFKKNNKENAESKEIKEDKKVDSEAVALDDEKLENISGGLGEIGGCNHTMMGMR